MGEGSKQVRVDNWGVFFLQRLQMFFSKTDYCDLTLQFEGNVQLKVHRLVMNACTEYFTILERTYPAIEDNTIMMPGDLQSDVIVPIVNFMYTGMLEFHMSIFEKLYTAAELMNITILTKLLDAQRIAYQQHRLKHKIEVKPKPEVSWMKKPLQKEKAPSFPNDLPHPLPGRKVPVWKRKAAPNPVPHPVSQLHFPEHRYPMDPLSIPDNTPKPTRFEWPEDDLPAFNFMDSSFEDFTLTSKPLLTKEDEDKAKPSFDDLRYNVEVPKKKASNSKASSSGMNTAEVEEFVKEQKIRTAMFEDVESGEGGGQKRKMDHQATPKQIPKKVKVNNKENQETTISVEGSDLTDLASIDHTKIVAEILKKYPDLVKKNKNIKLKIMTSGSNKNSPEKVATHVAVENSKKPPKQAELIKQRLPSATVKKYPRRKEVPDEGPWVCRKCIAMGAEPQEFVLYYLYRKHMTDTHNEQFDSKMCKYCGKRCGNDNLMMYHMYTKHALKPPSTYNFPKCERCPFIAQSTTRLDHHKELHKSNEMQCQDCKLAFTSSQTLGAHVRVTGHYNKPGKASFDCQYCMKKLQSAINLFTHIKNSHMREGKRDGIVCLDELESMEELDEEVEEEIEKDEYIIPDTLPEVPSQKDKVKIISNVKVPPNRQKADSTHTTQVVQLDPSSEAESLNNVASGIATSLGLVDIVVLDNNQQYILQQDGQHEQEFIIPELGSGQSFARQVITTQHNAVLQQGMIQSAGSDIGSTDELVMVLTDHEYPDEQEGENSDNSNIVVLYSHPVEGQEGQFITSQGNLLVNSQTGMLEIRNGTSITTASSNQVVVTNDNSSPEESIELIHREIHGSEAVMKQEPVFEEDRKPDRKDENNENPKSQEEVVENQSEDTPEESESPERLENGVNKNNEVEQEATQDKEKESEDIVDGNEDIGTEEPMEIDDIEENGRAKNSENDEQEYAHQDTSEEQFGDTSMEETDAQSPRPENKEEQEDTSKEESQVEQEEGVDVSPEKSFETSTQDMDNLVINDPANIGGPTTSTEENTEEQVRQGNDGTEQMEVDGKIVEKPDGEEQENQIESYAIPEEEKVNRSEGEAESEETQADKTTVEIEPMQPDQEVEPVESQDVNQDPDSNEEDVIKGNNDDTENSLRENEDSSKTLEEDNNTVQEKENHDGTKKSQVDINKTILDDWEEDDTDSQQSEKQLHEEKEGVTNSHNEVDNQTRAVDNVNKLMDDWEEEDEEEKKDAE